MKVSIILALLTLLIIGCSPNKTEEYCLEPNALIDGECVELSEETYTLYHALEKFNAYESYTLNALIENDNENIHLTLASTPNVRMVVSPNETLYYEQLEDSCQLTTHSYNTSLVETIDCTEDPTELRFYNQLDYTWFEFDGSVFTLKPGYFEFVDTVFIETMPTATLMDFQLTLDNESLHSLELVLTTTEGLTTMTLTFSDYDKTTITVPMEDES